MIEAAILADIFCAAVSIVWLLAAIILRKKGQPFHLHHTFWYIATPAIAGAMILISRIGYEIVFH